MTKRQVYPYLFSLGVDAVLVSGAAVASYYIRSWLPLRGHVLYPLSDYIPFVSVLVGSWLVFLHVYGMYGGMNVWNSSEFAKAVFKINYNVLILVTVVSFGLRFTGTNRIILFGFLVFSTLLLYVTRRYRPLAEELGRPVEALFWALLSLVLLIFWLKYQFTGRVLLASLAFLCFFFVIGLRFGIRWLIRRAQPKGEHDFHNVIVVGDDEQAGNVIRAIKEPEHLGLRVLGQIREVGGAAVEPDSQVLGTLADFSRILKDRIVDTVVFAVPYGRVDGIREALSYCFQVGVQVLINVDPFEGSAGLMRMEAFAGLSFITFPTTALSDHQRSLKRCFDLALSLAMLVLLSPVMLVAAILIKLSSARGPVFFRQERVGINGRRFTLYKFRTMVVGAEHIKSQLLHMNEMDGPVFKMRDDPRVTRLGRFLRRSSIDEFPQLFNVVMGHMSIVGPRPPLPAEVEKYELRQRRRLSVKPGLTCLWQVSGRNKVDFNTWMKLDLYYIDNWSWWLDLKILLRTIPAIFRGQ